MYDQIFREHGIGGFLTPQSYEMAWTQYMQMLADKLNELTAGTEYYNMKVKDISLRFARDPQSASLFNYASMSFNNHFFFKNLSSSPKALETQPNLKEQLEMNFGSIDTLRTTFLDTAAAMFGPGFVWLVYARDVQDPYRSTGRGSLRILTTYLAGSPHPEAGYRQQGIDMATSDASSADAYMSSQPANSVGMFGAHSAGGREQAKIPPGGTHILPLLCVNTWQHVYLRDYGVTGKRQFLTDWWDAVDWHSVNSLCPPEMRVPKFRHERGY